MTWLSALAAIAVTWGGDLITADHASLPQQGDHLTVDAQTITFNGEPVTCADIVWIEGAE